MRVYRGLTRVDLSPLERYVDKRVPPGDFLIAILSNDLYEACSRADDYEKPLLADYVAWLENNAPGSCWGSPEKVMKWLRGVDGKPD